MPLPTWYSSEPSHDISLCELEMGVRDRIALLASFDGEEIASETSSSVAASTQNSIDLATHLLLRLAVAVMDQSQALHWFSYCESKLFESRLSTSLPDGEWWTEYRLHYECVNPTPRNEWFEARNGNPQMIVKVPFQEVAHLVKGRHVQLEDGFALVPSAWMTNVVSHSPQLHSAVMNIVDMLRVRLRLNEHASDMGVIGPFTVPQLSDAAQSGSLPLCAHRLHRRLDTVGWLHHDQRRQYVLFLKSCGLQLEDAVSLLQSAHKTSHNAEVRPKRKWDRYDYEIHHMYGLRGKRVASQLFSCSGLAEMQPKASDGGVAGCPFANLDTAAITHELGSLKVPTDGFFDNISGRNAPLSMCQKHFELVHGGHVLNMEGGRHPAHWTLTSLSLRQSKNK